MLLIINNQVIVANPHSVDQSKNNLRAVQKGAVSVPESTQDLSQIESAEITWL